MYMICYFLITKATNQCYPCLTYLQHLTQLIILSLYTVSILTLYLLILCCNAFHLMCLIVHKTSHYLIIVLILLLYTQVVHRVQFLDLFFWPCISSLCLQLLTHTLSSTILLLISHNNRWLPPRWNIWATSVYAVIYERCQSLGYCEHA